MQHLKSRGITSLTLPGYYSDCRHVSSVVLVVVISRYMNTITTSVENKIQNLTVWTNYQMV